jgi:glycolate oxidase iron-sulfur subunit
MSNQDSALKTALHQESERLLACVHCGLCLPTCPTYRQLGNENDSPRGRLYLMRAVAEERLTPSAKYVQHLDLCLGCRACETVCPSGVPFGHLLETARADLVLQPPANLPLSAVRRQAVAQFVLGQLFTRPRLLALIWAMVRLLQRSQLVAKINQWQWLKHTPGYFPFLLLENARSPLDHQRGRLLTGTKRTTTVEKQPVDFNSFHSANQGTSRQNLPPVGIADNSAFSKAVDTNNGQPIDRLNCAAARPVAQFQGCIMEGLFAETNRATTRVLQRAGQSVVFPAGQGCCGALHAHAGLRAEAIKLAQANIESFVPANEPRSLRPIIVNAAGCGAMLKNYAELLHDQPDYAERARHFSQQVQDVSEFLATCPLPPTAPLPWRVTYDAPCHLYHGQGVRQAPLQLLQAINGLEVIPLAGSEQCCGSAGTYNINQPAMAQKLLAEKLQAIDQTQAQIVVTGNPGCAMHLAAGLQAAARPILVLHPVELLDLAQSGQCAMLNLPIQATTRV